MNRLGKRLSKLAKVANELPTLIVIRSSFGELIPIPLAPIDCGVGDPSLTAMANAKQARDFRGAATRWGSVRLGILDDCEAQMEWLGEFSVFCHSTVGQPVIVF